MEPPGLGLQKQRGSSSSTHQPPCKHILGYSAVSKYSTQLFNPSSRGGISLRHAKDTIKGGHPCPHHQDPQALHFRSGLTLPTRLEVSVHWGGLHVRGKLRQRAGEFFSADDREGEGGRARAHGDVTVRRTVRAGRGGRAAGAHGHVAVLRAVRSRRVQRRESARLHKRETARLMHSQPPPSWEHAWTEPRPGWFWQGLSERHKVESKWEQQETNTWVEMNTPALE